MSYDIYLETEDGVLCMSSQRIQEGGTQVMGGTKECHLNITYNYSTLYRLTLDRDAGLRWLHGKTGKDTIGRLENAVELLGTHQYERCVDNCDKCGFTCGYGEGLSDPMLPENRRSDYWAPTTGNAGHALNILLGWAKENPNGTWSGD